MNCEICGDAATYRMSPDLDIQGLGSCELHREIMRQAYLILMTMGEDEYQALINEFQKSESELQ